MEPSPCRAVRSSGGSEALPTGRRGAPAPAQQRRGHRAFANAHGFLLRWATLKREPPANPKRAGNEQQPGAPPGKTLPPVPASRRARLWWFRAAAALLPLALLALVESGLRLAGVGKPTAFFLRREAAELAEGQPPGRVWIDNRWFGWRFFPPAVAREPEPTFLRDEPTRSGLRVFILGESAAMGDPEPDYGVGRWLEVLLQERLPDVNVEVINAAMTAINSHVVREIAADCRTVGGDVWVLYMGNNEVVGPYGAGTVLSAQTPPLPVIRAAIAFRETRVGQWLSSFSQVAPGMAEWQGMEMFLEQQVSRDDPRMKSLYAHFAANLEAILKQARRANVQVVLSTVVANLKDCPPFASQHRQPLNANQLQQWKAHRDAAVEALAEGQAAKALVQVEAALALDAGHAEAHFLRGQCLLALGRGAEARAAFSEARDLDTLRFRVDSQLNRLIREAAARHPEAGFVDAETLFDQANAAGIAGAEHLLEHVHLTPEGNYLLARHLAEDILERRLPGAVRSRRAGAGELPDFQTCARRLGLTDFNRLAIAREVTRRLQQPPFTAQLGHAQQLAVWTNRIAAMSPAGRAEGLRGCIEQVREAQRARPQDWVLRRNMAKMLEEAGETEAALREWAEVMRALPHEPEAFYRLGNLAEELGRHAEAARWYEETLRRLPDSIEAVNGLGLVALAQGRAEEAMARFREAMRLKPGFVESRVNLGRALAAAGRTAEARAEYEEALRRDPGSLAAHLNLGKLLSGLGDKEAALAHYTEALRLQPGHAIAHFNMANTLAGLNRAAEAMAHYEAALESRPDFAEARFNLGQELARLGRLREGVTHLEQAVKARPDWGEAHVALGAALARQGRWDEAIARFKEALRLQPGHAVAARYLAEAQARRRGP